VRSFVPGERFRYLTCNPFGRRRICCDVDPDEVSAAEPDGTDTMLRSTFAVLKKTIATQKNRFNAFDERLDAWADRHWPVVGIENLSTAIVVMKSAQDGA
jgi:hypothetical protein